MADQAGVAKGATAEKGRECLCQVSSFPSQASNLAQTVSFPQNLDKWVAEQNPDFGRQLWASCSADVDDVYEC